MDLLFGAFWYFLKVIHIEKDNLMFGKNQLYFLPLSALLSLLNNVVSLGRFDVLPQHNTIALHLPIDNSVAIDHPLDLAHNNRVGYLG